MKEETKNSLEIEEINFVKDWTSRSNSHNKFIEDWAKYIEENTATTKVFS